MSAASQTTDALWQKVVQDYRQLFVLRRQGRHEESTRLLHGQLQTRIAEWSAEDPTDAAAKRQRLNEMFQAEQRRLDDVWYLQDIMEQRLRAEFLPALTERIAEEVRQAVAQATAALKPAPAPRPAPRPEPRQTRSDRPVRVSAGDIPSIIDMLLDGEHPAQTAPLAA